MVLTTTFFQLLSTSLLVNISSSLKCPTSIGGGEMHEYLPKIIRSRISGVEAPEQIKKSGRGWQRNVVCFNRSWCASSSNEMENNGNIPCQQKTTVSLSSNHSAQDTQATSIDNVNSTAFVNHALILWTEKRREWVGSQQQSRPEEPREPVIGWSTTYEDLLGVNRLFPQPIPLPEMVDFLVDVWEQEGLYE
ncbi:unnamed protein product [Sphagnum troendelagicum]|uniref:Gag1-like clamp domain-containing protein n=1 Tax=Sphagnum troendelagicum TaxID=128251 RepID=A0ABP0U575_9BRYO